MALTDAKLRAARAGAKPYKLPDGEGLYLLVTPAGGKIWRFKYRIAGKEKLLVIGPYPAVALKLARRKRDDAKELIAAGGDPAVEKQKTKAIKRSAAENTFKVVALEWHENEKGKWDLPRPISASVRTISSWRPPLLDFALA